MRATEDFIAAKVIAIALRLRTAKTLDDPVWLGRRKRLLEKGEVRSTREIPDLILGVPATTCGLESVLDRERVTRDADASIRESVRLHAGEIESGLARHLIRVCECEMSVCVGGCYPLTEKSRSIFLDPDSESCDVENLRRESSQKSGFSESQGVF